MPGGLLALGRVTGSGGMVTRWQGRGHATRSYLTFKNARQLPKSWGMGWLVWLERGVGYHGIWGHWMPF